MYYYLYLYRGDRISGIGKSIGKLYDGIEITEDLYNKIYNIGDVNEYKYVDGDIVRLEDVEIVAYQNDSNRKFESTNKQRLIDKKYFDLQNKISIGMSLTKEEQDWLENNYKS